MSEEEQLAIALALSQGNTSGGGSGGGGGGGSGGGGGGGGGLHTAGVARKWGEGGLDETAAPSVPGRPGLSAAEQEELLLAQSNVAPSLRNDPVVAAQAFRVAGDARGTASTLVGLTPEEEMELAMLKSKIAHEQPELNSPLPRADAAAGRGGGGSYLSAFGGGTATTATFDAGAPLQLPSIAPLVAPPQHAAGSRSRGRHRHPPRGSPWERFCAAAARCGRAGQKAAAARQPSLGGSAQAAHATIVRTQRSIPAADSPDRSRPAYLSPSGCARSPARSSDTRIRG